MESVQRLQGVGVGGEGHLRDLGRARNACPEGGTGTGRASQLLVVCSVAALRGGVARQHPHLLVAIGGQQHKIGRLCKVLWGLRCPTPLFRPRANEQQERVSQGGRSGMQSTQDA